MPDHAVGTDVYYSSDADDTETIKIGADFDLRYESPDDYLGFRLEKARFSPLYLTIAPISGSRAT